MTLPRDQAGSGHPCCPARLSMGSEAKAKAGESGLPADERGASEEVAEIRAACDHPDPSSGGSAMRGRDSIPPAPVPRSKVEEQQYRRKGLGCWHLSLEQGTKPGMGPNMQNAYRC